MDKHAVADRLAAWQYRLRINQARHMCGMTTAEEVARARTAIEDLTHLLAHLGGE